MLNHDNLQTIQNRVKYFKTHIRKPFENSVPSLEKIDELCAEYPALKIAYDKFRNVWRICYNDYVSKNPDEENY